MRTVEIGDVTALLSRTRRRGPARTPLIVTRQGKLVAALVPAASDDWEDSVVANDPGFAAVMKRSEKRYRAEGGASIDEVRARYGMPAKPAPKRRPRKAASSR